MRKPIYRRNGEGDNVIIGYEGTSSKKEQEALEAGIRLAKEIGREQAAQRGTLKNKLASYMIQTDDDDR